MPKLIVKDDPPSGPKLKPKEDAQEAQPKPQAARGRAQKTERPPDIHQTPPHSVEAELGVLSSILQDFQYNKSSKIMAQVAAKIIPYHFFVPAHKTTYEMFMSLWKADAPIDLISFTEILREKRLLDSIGGPTFITNLIGYVPTAANIEYYCEIMLEQARRREMISIGTGMVRAAYGSHDEDSIELLKSFEGRITRLRETNRDAALVDVADMLNGAKPPLPRLIVRRLLHQGAKMIIGGSSKARKTWGLMDLALSVATGTDWWGFQTYKNPVCYINLELQDPFFAERMADLASQKEVQPEHGWFDVLNLRGRIETVESLRQKYTPYLKARHFRMLIIDPSYKLLGGRDENAAGEIATLLNEFEKIATDIEAAVVFASHYSKGNQALKEFMDRIGGSGVFARDPDVVMTMTQHEDDDCFTVESRCRNLASPPAFVVRWEYPMFALDDEKNPQRLRGKGGRPPEWKESIVLDQLSVLEGWATGKLQKHLYAEKDLPRRRFYDILARLDDSGKIIKKDGLWFRKSRSDETSSDTSDTFGTSGSPDE